MTFRILLISLFLLIPQVVGSAPPKLRPVTGIGFLLIPVATENETDLLPFYRTPGVGRLREIRAKDLPRLTMLAPLPPEAMAVVIVAKKGNWLKTEWDEAGHGGWFTPRRSWRYFSWNDFLPGATVRMLPGLQKMYYGLRDNPSPRAEQLLLANHQDRFAVDRVEDEWLLVKGKGNKAGWLQWKDDNGRFLVTMEPPAFFSENN